MKKVIFSTHFLFFLFFSIHANCQQVQNLPPGSYLIKTRTSSNAWKAGNIILKTDGSYVMSSSNETGEYKFSVAGQRLFFTSGPLKGVYALTRMDKNIPVIVFPASEPQPFTISEDVVAQWSQ